MPRLLPLTRIRSVDEARGFVVHMVSILRSQATALFNVQVLPDWAYCLRSPLARATHMAKLERKKNHRSETKAITHAKSTGPTQLHLTRWGTQEGYSVPLCGTAVRRDMATVSWTTRRRKTTCSFEPRDESWAFFALSSAQCTDSVATLTGRPMRSSHARRTLR